jgi:hypothetical protein
MDMVTSSSLHCVGVNSTQDGYRNTKQSQLTSQPCGVLHGYGNTQSFRERKVYGVVADSSLRLRLTNRSIASLELQFE